MPCTRAVWNLPALLYFWPGRPVLTNFQEVDDKGLKNEQVFYH